MTSTAPRATPTAAPQNGRATTRGDASQKRRFELYANQNTLNKQAQDNAPIPQDVNNRPRVAPDPVSSGISFRNLPEATLEQIIRCCHHYEEKASGKYSARTLAARYLFDLSREVQDLTRVLRNREAERESRIRYLEHLVKNWADVFGTPSEELRRLGIKQEDSESQLPSNIANKLISLDRQLRSKQNELDESKQKFRDDIETMRRHLDEQSRAAKESTSSEVAEVTRRYEKEMAELERQRDAAQEEVERQKSRLHENYQRHVYSEINQAVQTEASRWESANEQLRQQLDETSSEVNRLRDQLKSEQSTREHDNRRSNQAIEDLRKQLQHQQQAAEDAAKSAARQVEECRYKHAQELQSQQEEFANTVAAQRVRDLESKCRWLANRVLELQRLADSLQAALAREMGMPVATETLKRLQQYPQNIDQIIQQKLKPQDEENKTQEASISNVASLTRQQYYPQYTQSETGTLSNGVPPQAGQHRGGKQEKPPGKRVMPKNALQRRYNAAALGWVEPGPLATPSQPRSTGHVEDVPGSTAFNDVQRPRTSQQLNHTQHIRQGQRGTNSTEEWTDEGLTGLSTQEAPLGDSELLLSGRPDMSRDSLLQSSAVYAMEDASRQGKQRDPVPIFYHPRRHRD
eukprot:gb/GECG01015457.1/.p1 GENE.gb/GECG01015457.1/~~gb/GECG01015457.1/.p1  ORF type:complete len:634 (+),score=97.71 gb/GECG01015457.1/:1-1902(+)